MVAAARIARVFLVTDYSEQNGERRSEVQIQHCSHSHRQWNPLRLERSRLHQDLATGIAHFGDWHHSFLLLSEQSLVILLARTGYFGSIGSFEWTEIKRRDYRRNTGGMLRLIEAHTWRWARGQTGIRLARNVKHAFVVSAKRIDNMFALTTKACLRLREAGIRLSPCPAPGVPCAR